MLVPAAAGGIIGSVFLFAHAGDRPAPHVPPPIMMKSCSEPAPPEIEAFVVGPHPDASGVDPHSASDTLFRFVYDAVFRRDPARGWDLATDRERSGMTRAAWATGTIPVVPEPVSPACVIGVRRSKQTEWIVAVLVHRDAFLCYLELVDGRWLVDYLMPLVDTSKFVPYSS